MTRALPLLAALAVALSPACSSPGPRRAAPAACATTADCPAASYCRDGACFSDDLPVARIAGPRTAKAHVELVFDGNASSDPDDGIASYAWTARAVAAPCPAEPGAGEGPAFHPIFPCPGEFEVSLVVRDARGLESAPALHTLRVEPQDHAAPSVSVGAPLQLAHRCAGAPLACTPVDAGGAPTFQLRVAASDERGSDVASYRWEAAPPPELASGGATVEFLPGPNAQTPLVALRTPGTRIAGTWRFTVTATDANGLSSRAVQEVAVLNRPPVVSGGAALALPHAYDAATRTYRIAGQLAPSIEDPDGDPVTVAWDLRASEVATCSFAFTSGTAFLVACTDPHELIGSVTRTVALRASDGNGGEGTTSWTVAGTNRPPVLAPVPASLAFDHRVETVDGASAFVVAGASPFVASDPDGDPIGPVELALAIDAAAPRSRGSVGTDAVSGAAAFRFWTPVDAPAEFRTASGSSPFRVKGSVADAWSTATSAGFAVEIRDRAPVPVGPAVPAVAVDHRYDGAAYVTDAALLQAFADPDGDPLTLEVDAGSSALCRTFAWTGPASPQTATVTCRLAYAIGSGPPTLAQLTAPQALRYAAVDPWSLRSAAATTLQVTNAAPSVALPAAVVVGAAQTCGSRRCGYEFCPYARAASGPVAGAAVDPENDPVAVSWSGPATAAGATGCGGLAPGPSTCASGGAACAEATVTTCDAAPDLVVGLVASDGAAASARRDAVVTTTCADLVP